MYTGTLDMLHDTRNQYVGSVTDCIYLDLSSLQIFIYQNRMILGNGIDDADELVNLIIVPGNLHALSAQHIGRSYQHRIPDPVCHFLGFLRSKYSSAGCTRNSCLLQNLIEQLTVFGCVYILCLSSQNRNAHLHKCFCQLDCSLSTKLNHSAVRLLDVHDRLHILRGQRLKVKLVGNIKVRRYRLRVVVDDNRLPALLGKRPGTVYGAEVELDTLSDTDRA